MLALTPTRWWLVALRGIAAILFGLLALAMPGLTLTFLVLLFGAYALVDGIVAVVAGIAGGLGHARGWLTLLIGLVGIVVGILTFAQPGITALALLSLIAAWAIVTGVIEIVLAFGMGGGVGQELGLALRGILTALFGVYIIVFPGAGALAIAWLIGIYAIIAGVLVLIHAFRVRSMTTTMTGSSPA
jgi:uncharacterized membrane protein HdeD (DUF308 family)